MNIIYPPTIEWEGAAVYQRPQQLLSAFAALGHRAIFIEPGGSCSVKIFQGVEVCGLDDVPKGMIGPTVLWVTHPPHLMLKSRLQADHVVFDYIDEAVEEFAVWNDRHMKEAIEGADLVTVVSKSLYETVADQYPGKPLLLLPNAADFEHFRHAEAFPIPNDLAALPKPIIGFYGSISTWIDTAFLASLAGRRPDWSFVMIGPDYINAAGLLAEYPNIHFLGRKPYAVLPAYAGHFDAAMIPFQVRTMTHSSSPIKMYEFLAAGIPVLSTPIREAVHCPHVYTSDDPDAWCRELDRLLQLGKDINVFARIAYAEKHSWKARAAVALERLLIGTYAVSARGMNSEQYWDSRFNHNWEVFQGREQTVFFAELAIQALPAWIKDDIGSRRLRICDAGCALGDAVRLIAEHWRMNEVVGIDFSESAITKASSIYPQHLFRQGNIRHLEETFDVIFCSNTLEHFADPHGIIDHLLSQTNDYLILMMPFHDDSGEPEHLYRFIETDFYVRRGSFLLCFAEVIDCRSMPGSRWGGKQIAAVYVHESIAKPENMTLGSYKIS
ncbi:methyltransferase domain-containing protein [Paenibacillus contaminans]|uniref:Methyltransferase domain-containing protein n=1 Tax=Paenibacillus contaminans TaxID=450362 RepID=A0A329MWU1_9BACL|nr:methyltransferase domain-containing protein [Paenibacillus contaminans]RAV22923.1 hypothetical protein DQG23_01585 [Paenibacillus contaminans]